MAKVSNKNLVFDSIDLTLLVHVLETALEDYYRDLHNRPNSTPGYINFIIEGDAVRSFKLNKKDSTQ